MTAWSALYENPRRLAADWGYARIFAPEAYRRVRCAAFAPIAQAEAMTLAAHVPLCWRKAGGRATLGALRSLFSDGRGHLAGSARARPPLPLALRAYPLILKEDEAEDSIWLDDVPADQPTDVGAPLLLADGRPSRGALHRLRALLALREQAAPTQALSDALDEGGFLEPWALDFELAPDGRRLVVDDMLVVKPSRLNGRDARALLSAFGVEAATLISLHRISLFKAAFLLQAARAAVAAETGAARPAA